MVWLGRLCSIARYLSAAALLLLFCCSVAALFRSLSLLDGAPLVGASRERSEQTNQDSFPVLPLLSRRSCTVVHFNQRASRSFVRQVSLRPHFLTNVSSETPKVVPLRGVFRMLFVCATISCVQVLSVCAISCVQGVFV